MTTPQYGNLATFASINLLVLTYVTPGDSVAEDIAFATTMTQDSDREVAIAGMFRYFYEVSQLDETKHPLIAKCRRNLIQIGERLISELRILPEDLDRLEDWYRADVKDPKLLATALSLLKSFRDLCRKIHYSRKEEEQQQQQQSQQTRS